MQKWSVLAVLFLCCSSFLLVPSRLLKESGLGRLCVSSLLADVAGSSLNWSFIPLRVVHVVGHSDCRAAVFLARCVPDDDTSPSEQSPSPSFPFHGVAARNPT